MNEQSDATPWTVRTGTGLCARVLNVSVWFYEPLFKKTSEKFLVTLKIPH